jgi:uncharacterized protein YndB with AHSA1/START domain
MKQARASTLIASPPQAVFEFVAVDFVRNYRRWSPEVQRLELFTPGPMKVGSRARQVRMDQGRRSEHTFRVVAFEPPRRISFAEIADRFRIDYQMEPEGDQTRLTFLFELRRMELYMRPFEKLIRVALQEGAERVVGNIKRLIETESRNNTRAQH